jgi:Short C-terminal domain
MLVRYIKAQLVVLLFGGIVGPAFVIGYFAVGPSYRHAIDTLFYIGVLITIADVAIAIWLANVGEKAAVKKASLEQHGVLALAQITGLTETSMEINDRRVVKVDLHIAGPGCVPFDSQARVTSGFAQQGNLYARKLVVLVNPTTQEYEIDWERSSLVNGLVPAKFTSEEDNKTYDLSGQAGPLMEILQILKANNVPVNGIADIRSNPALRQQIQSVVRRAVAEQVPAAAPAQPAAPQASIAERLQELETLHASGVLTEQEYSSRRAQIISEI